MDVYFYPHKNLRDRQLDTIRFWKGTVCNPEIATGRVGTQVPRANAIQKKPRRSLKQLVPLLNLKKRPPAAPKSAVVYVWGGLIAQGDFIVDLDNPWSLVGYNPNAIWLYRCFIRRLLLSDRCKAIYCLSEACKQSLQVLFGDAVYKKATVRYPVKGIVPVTQVHCIEKRPCRLLFVGSQFEIKGGMALLDAFEKIKQEVPDVVLEMITHLPPVLDQRVSQMEGVTLHAPVYTRSAIFEMMQRSDVLVHPSYMESFGMTILEALAQGLVIVANDIYAIREMVEHEKNGFLLAPPVSKWDGVMPNQFFTQKAGYLDAIRTRCNETYVCQLSEALLACIHNPERMHQMKMASLARFLEMRGVCG